MDTSLLLEDLDRAESLLGQFSGGYSGTYLSAEDFREDLLHAIGEVKKGNLEALNDLRLWFLPTSVWDDFTKNDGIQLGNSIFEKLAELRKELITINLVSPQSINELHKTFARELGFPDFYGMNWDAFWDAITGLVELPKKLILTDGQIFSERYPEASKILHELIEGFNSQSSVSKIIIEK